VSILNDYLAIHTTQQNIGVSIKKSDHIRRAHCKGYTLGCIFKIIIIDMEKSFNNARLA
jgi:hypothetical protein